MSDVPFYLSGFGAVSQIGQLKDHFAPSKTLLVTGRGSYAASGAQVAIEAAFAPETCLRFCDFDVNPKLEDALRGVVLARDAGVDFILAVGGGSVMDMGKLIKALYADPSSGAALVRGETPVRDAGVPLVTIPTTAGSGSEATHFAVAYIGTDKYSLAAPCLLPDGVLLDGALLASNSPYQRAVNGLDALAQGIESFWAKGASEQSRGFARTAISGLALVLPEMVQGSDAKTLQNMAEAANLAGQAINISKTTAAHAFSYGFTSHHCVPHGHAVWLTLPEVFQIHMDMAQGDVLLASLMAEICDLMGLTGPNYAETLRGFLRRLNVCPDMMEMGAKTEEQRVFLAQQVNMQRMSNNPVALGKDHIAQIFKLSSFGA